jgi:hypothetical protein
MRVGLKRALLQYTINLKLISISQSEFNSRYGINQVEELFIASAFTLPHNLNLGIGTLDQTSRISKHSRSKRFHTEMHSINGQNIALTTVMIGRDPFSTDLGYVIWELIPCYALVQDSPTGMKLRWWCPFQADSHSTLSHCPYTLQRHSTTHPRRSSSSQTIELRYS